MTCWVKWHSVNFDPHKIKESRGTKDLQSQIICEKVWKSHKIFYKQSLTCCLTLPTSLIDFYHNFLKKILESSNKNLEIIFRRKTTHTFTNIGWNLRSKLQMKAKLPFDWLKKHIVMSCNENYVSVSILSRVSCKC